MALTIINGLRDVGKLGSEYYGKKMENFMYMLKAGNTTEERNGLLNFLDTKTKTIDRIPGQPIPIDIFNVYFTQGGYTDNGYAFSKYTEKFTMPMGRGLNAITYNYSTEEILDARNNNIDLMKDIQEKLEAYIVLYQNQVLPYKKLQALITGSDLTAKIPTEATKTSDDNYTRSAGWLRGEDIEDFKKGHIQKTHACHYRGTRGSTFAISDIDDAIDTLKMYRDASPEKPFALANSRTIRNTVASSLEYANNRDEVLVFDLKYREALGCRWIDMDTFLPEGVILFLDANATDIILKAVQKDEMQRGIAFIKDFQGEMKKIDSFEDLMGGSVHVFPSEQLVFKRHMGLILDTENQGKTELGKEGWADTATVEKLENYAQNLVDQYLKPMK